MHKNQLVQELINLAHSYGREKYGNSYIHPLENTSSSIIFYDLEHSFHPESWKKIDANTNYKMRTQKVHSNSVTKVFEMQSSNSSDALAMNIFCFPDFENREEVLKLLNIKYFDSIEFGYKPKLKKRKKNTIGGDTSEVDIFINESIMCECKLTEDGFTQKEKSEVKKYIQFEKVFNVNKLIQNDNKYSNYQLIRNILAAEQHNSRFILICDMRRPDLAKCFYETISCIKDEYLDLRNNCEIIYWQDFAQVVDDELKVFLEEKYGII